MATQPQHQHLVWFITGASKGLGLTLVNQLLVQGHHVAATSRHLDDLQKAVGNDSDAFLPLAVDLVTESSVQAAVQATIDRFGQIDVVVNNAGYGQIGSLEELSDREARANFDINVFGSLNVIRHVMPQLRKQQSGHIMNLSSIGGFYGEFPRLRYLLCHQIFRRRVFGVVSRRSETVRHQGNDCRAGLFPH